VLSAKGAVWEAVGQSVTENKTVENMERITIAMARFVYGIKDPADMQLNLF
jgi:hypothetical protein